MLILGQDRVGRSLVELVSFLETCRGRGVGLHLHEQKQRIDTATDNGLSLFDFGSIMAFHVHPSRRDRILRETAAARAASVRWGRPPIPSTKVEKAKQLLADGKGVRQVARLAGISAASASRLKNSAVLAH